MTSVEIVLMILRYLMALALVIIAFILIRRTFSKNKSESNRELRGWGKSGLRLLRRIRDHEYV